MRQFTYSDVRRQAAQLTGSTDELASRVPSVIERCGKESSARARAALDFELICLRHALASAFGARYGLVPTPGPFSITALREGRKPGGWSSLQAAWDMRLTDHPTFYRTPDRRAAAVAAHLYGLTDETRWRCIAWAARHGLQVTFPTGFPSWWCPRGTELVLYTSGAACHPAANDAR